MFVTPSHSISIFQMPTPPGPALSVAGGNEQPFAQQFAASIAPAARMAVVAPPALSVEASPAAVAATTPEVSGVTILPWGQSIARPLKAAATVSLLPVTPVIPPAAAAAAAPSAPASAPAAAVLPTSQQAINALSAILTGYGIDPASLGLSYSEQVVAGPTGSYTNRLITASFPSGKSQDYSADLTLKNPTVAAVEIMGMLGRRILA